MKSKFEDYNIFFIVVLLLLFGIGITFLSSYNISIKHFGHPYHYISRHIQYIVLGLISFFFFLKFPLKLIFQGKVIIVLFLLGLFFLILVFFPSFGKSISNAKRWLDFKIFQFQPSEIFKIIFLFTLAFILEIKEKKKNYFLEGMLLPSLIILISFFFIAVEPDFSTALIFLLTGFILLFIYKTRKTFILIILSFSFMVFIVIISNKKYLLNRFYFFKNSPEHVFNESYQLRQALLAFENSGFVGNNFKSVFRLIKNFPDVHTDFSFSVIVYAYGLLGTLFFFLLLFLFLNETLKLNLNILDKKEKFLSTGILVLIGCEFILHIFVNIGLLPTTGIFLPFVGYGGTALITHLGMIGILTQIKIKQQRDYATKTIL